MGPYGTPIGLYWRKSEVYDDLKNEAKIGLEISDKSFFFEVKFFSKCSKKFSIGHMIMFKVCKRCLQPCSLRQKKNYARTISTSKYIQKSWPPPNPLGGVTAKILNSAALVIFQGIQWENFLHFLKFLGMKRVHFGDFCHIVFFLQGLFFFVCFRFKKIILENL